MRKNISQQTIYQIGKEKLLLEDIENLLKPKKKQSQLQNYVLIIDEINRGNISKIFGDTITLLDSDKRVGAENETIITLPYSKKSFGLPANLFVVGTMNTADRSIALMDVALRRRFEFEEVMPDAAVIQKVLSGKNVSPDLISFIVNVFEILNKRIEVLYDREHQIGHSYFLDISNESEFYEVWNKKIIPLLQEYFYNNWERLGILLGSSLNGDGLIRSTESMESYKGIFNNGDVEYPSQIYRCATPQELTDMLMKVFKKNEQ